MSSKYGKYLTALASILLVSCAIQPQSAEEYRKGAANATFAKTETFVVNRSISAVTNSFKEKASKCLHKRVTTTSTGQMHYQSVKQDYIPTVKVTESRTELHLQQKYDKGSFSTVKQPENGYYVMVVDASSVGDQKTRIDMYYSAMGFGHVATAVKGWAMGKNVGCPDLTQF